MQNETLVFNPSLVFIIRKMDQNDPKQSSMDARSFFFSFFLLFETKFYYQKEKIQRGEGVH